MLLKKNKKKFNYIFLIFISIFSVVILSTTLYMAYKQTQKEAINYLEGSAKTVSHQTHLFLYELKVSLDDLLKDSRHCDKRTQQRLRNLALNEPKISIVYLKTPQTTCSTIGEIALNTKALSASDTFTMSGPMTIEGIMDNAYLIKRTRNDIEIGVFFPKRVLSELFNDHSTPLVTHLLLSKTNNQVLFPLSKKSLNLNAKRHKIRLTTINKLSVTDNIELHSYLSSTWVYHKLKPHLYFGVFLSLLIILLFAFILRKITQHKLSMGTELRFALKNNQIIPYYQPVIDLSTGQFSGVECLMRWKLNDKDIIQPDLFIPYAEKSGLIKPMTKQLIDIIFTQLGPYAQSHQNFHIAINLSPIHFKDRDTYNQVVTLCDQYHIHPSQVIFELTEEELIDEDDTLAVEIMNDMRKLGYSLAIDDFGTGYSSISYLTRFPFDFLKIDQQFVMAIGTHAITAQLADSMIDLAKNLNLKIIAEGIEKSIHETHLKNRNVCYAQGWLYSKALTFDELTAYIETNDSTTPMQSRD